MFHTSSFSYSANVKAKLEFFPHTPQLWLIDVGYMACKISYRRGCYIGGWFTWSLPHPHRYKWHGVRSGDLGGQGMHCSSYRNLLH
jgi:hypothetical protein